MVEIISTSFNRKEVSTMSEYQPEVLKQYNQLQPTKSYLVDEFARRLEYLDRTLDDEYSSTVALQILNRIKLVESESDRKLYQTSILAQLLDYVIDNTKVINGRIKLPITYRNVFESLLTSFQPV